MKQISTTKQSKFLSLILRHEPDKIGLTLDEAGWASVPELLAQLAAHGRGMSMEELEHVVTTNDKQRFSFNEDKIRIRANQGHSLKTLDLGLQPIEPPEILYHGTAERFLDSILQTGLEKRSRQHVHLSADEETAYKVGIRHGKPIILKVAAGQMQRDGFNFYRSDNGVWLTDHVPTLYLQAPLTTAS
ncbi:MAG: RNA 2'-phosphotransferase [Thiothrix sp.]|uniref:RNA 2'-phosphotransferase n=1 Tax=Thiothrix sp. TaxID=1032 RepID=UPI00260E5156|nr:RNA 2'-phosphotransferase [Thiothrix sp.]MDD5393649.1 RNA 2'-phosphotransferase [Thiothrix sp.]